MPRFFLLSPLVLLLIVFTACGGNDDTVALPNCGIDLVSARIDSVGDFDLRVRNDNNVEGQVSFVVVYSLGGVQVDRQGIGLANNVGPGTTVDIRTGSLVDTFTCAQLRVSFLSSAAGIACQNEAIGRDCYN